MRNEPLMQAISSDQNYEHSSKCNQNITILNLHKNFIFSTKKSHPVSQHQEQPFSVISFFLHAHT